MTWSFMTVRMQCVWNEGKWDVYALKELSPMENLLKDFIWDVTLPKTILDNVSGVKQ